MSKMASCLFAYKANWSGIGSISIQPVFSGNGPVQVGWHVSINGDYDSHVYPFADASDAVNVAILRWRGEWPMEVLGASE